VRSSNRIGDSVLSLWQDLRHVGRYSNSLSR